MNRLKGLRFYLCGPIEDVEDFGRDWRIAQTSLLHKYGSVVLDPTNKTVDVGVEDLKSSGFREQLKKEKRYRELKEYMRIIRSIDLRYVDVSDALIAYIDFDVKMWGTFEEIAIANRQKKPVLLVCKQGIDEINDWGFAQLVPELFFNNFTELNTYLDYVNTADKVEDYGRWRFLNL